MIQHKPELPQVDKLDHRSAKSNRLNPVGNQLTKIAMEHGGDGSSWPVRAKVLEILKLANAEGRQRAEVQLCSDGDGKKCARQISRLQDDLIKLIYDFAITHVYRETNHTAAESIAIVAVGGYGRGTLAPGSDIDLLFLIPYKLTAWGEQVIEYVLYMLWDMSFKVGHATRDIDESMRQASDDMTIRTSILEARYLLGEKSLFDEFVRRFNREIVRGSAAEFIEAKLAERDVRHEKSGQSRYLVEPNVKDGKGGFRDLHTLFCKSQQYWKN